MIDMMVISRWDRWLRVLISMVAEHNVKHRQIAHMHFVNTDSVKVLSGVMRDKQSEKYLFKLLKSRDYRNKTLYEFAILYMYTR